MAARSPARPAIDRPRRPILVELAAAILIAGPATDVIISFEAMTAAPTALGRVLAATSVSVGLLLLILGFLIRSGRGWLVTLNVAAVAAFLSLQSLSFVGLLAALLDMVVVGILLRERWWFQWHPPPDGPPAELDRRTGQGWATEPSREPELDQGPELDRGPERA